MNIIGIDFGSSKCCAGVWVNNKVEIITLDQGRKIPSFVSLTQDGIVVGEASLN